MFLTLAVAVLVSANPVKIVAPGWQFTGLERTQGEIYEARFLTLLGERSRLDVVTQRDVEAALGLERQRQLLGCDSGSKECMAELTSALGASVVLSGSLAKTEKSYVVTLRAVNTTTGTAYATATARLGGEDALFSWLEQEAVSFADRLRDSFDASKSVHYRYETWPWVAIGGGVLAFAAGATLFGLSRIDLSTIRGSPPPPGDPLITGGQFKQDFGVALGIGGLAVVAAGVGLLLWTREPQRTIEVAVAPMAGGGLLSVGGHW